MDALISARAGLALIFDRKRNKISLFRGGNSAPASVVDASLLLDDVKKLEDASQDEIHRQFRKNVAQEEAIDLALLAIDPQLSQRTRAAAVRELETIIEQKGMLDGLKNVLYARPLPASSSISDAVSISKGNNCKAVSQFFKDLQLLQPSIRDIWLGWTAISEAEISSIESKEAFQSALLSSGLFAQFAEAVPVKKVNEFLLRALSDPVLASMPGARVLFLRWAEPFRNLKDQSALYPTEEDWENFETEKRSRPTRSRVPHLREILSRVKAQKQAIKDALNRRDVSLAHKFLADLKTDQLKHGGAKFLVKSLCDIAMEAKRIGFYEFQLNLLEDAAELERGDPRVWCQLGDSLLTRDRPLKALEAFRQAEALGDERGGMIGRAEVAKATNDLPQALQLYDKVIEVFPDDPVPQNARAEILKLLNSLDDALAAYDQILKTFPYDITAKVGRAEALKDLHRLDQSLKAYDEILTEHPEHSVANCGRAELLKTMGKFKRSFEAYETIVARHPESVVARTGKAGVLKALDRLSEALANYDEVLNKFPHDVVARIGRFSTLVCIGRYEEVIRDTEPIDPVTPSDWKLYHIRGMAFMLSNKFDRAIEIFEEGISKNPRPGDRQYFRSALAVAQLRKHDYAAAIKLLEKVDTPELALPRNVLRMHGHGAMGHLTEAVALFEIIREPLRIVSKELADELFRRFVSGDGAPLYNDDSLMREEGRVLLVA